MNIKLDENLQCILQVTLSISDGRRSKPLKALIDTGSYYNHVSAGYIDPDLQPIGKASFQTLGGKVEENDKYECFIEMPELKIGGKFEFLRNIYLFHGIDVLLGTHFLYSFNFKYNCPSHGEFSIEPFINNPENQI